LLGWESVLAIVAATNAYAMAALARVPKDVKRARGWSTLSPGEFLTWLGLLFCMGLTVERRRKDHWPGFSRFMSQFRWEQIHRFLTFNMESVQPGIFTPDDPPWLKCEPIYSTIRANCVRAVTPATWVTVDEVMIAF
jgi:hypothetical protein